MERTSTGPILWKGAGSRSGASIASGKRNCQSGDFPLPRPARSPTWRSRRRHVSCSPAKSRT
ncbi:hypothetical protein ACFPRL_31845 [Pseudoclavibacter helvolus]